MNFQENTSNENRVTAEKAQSFSRKAPLITDGSQRKLYSIREKGEVRVFRKHPTMEAETQPKRCFVPPKQSGHYCYPIGTIPTSFLAEMWRFRGMNFHEIHSNGNRYVGENVLCSAGEVPFVIHRSRPNLSSLCRMAVGCVV
jgi:hypothetical protein